MHFSIYFISLGALVLTKQAACQACVCPSMLHQMCQSSGLHMFYVEIFLESNGCLPQTVVNWWLQRKMQGQTLNEAQDRKTKDVILKLAIHRPRGCPWRKHQLKLGFEPW